MSLAAAVGAGVGCTLAGVALDRWLGTRGYRYDDELQLPPRSTWWVVPALAVAGGVLGARGVQGTPGTDEVALVLVYAVALAWMAALTAIDLDVRRLPDRLTLPAYPVVPAALGVCAWAAEDVTSWAVALACGAATGLVYMVLALVNPSGMGWGDVKLAAPLGMLVGWFGWPAAFAAFFLAFGIGLVVGLVAAVRSGRGRKSTFPFGPAMLAGAALVVLAAV